MKSISTPLNRRLKIKWSPDLGYVQKVDRRVTAQCEAALKVLEGLGHTVEETSLALPDMGVKWGVAMGLQEFLMVGDALKGREAEMETWVSVPAACYALPSCRVLTLR